MLVILIVVLLICIPVAWFVFTNLKQGWDDAERFRARRPPPALADNSPVPGPPGTVDFSKFDMSGNSTDVHNRTDHFAANLPPLRGRGRSGFHEGLVGQGNFELRGGIVSLSGAAQQRLPSSTHSGGLVTLELAVVHGTIRAYLQGRNGNWVSGYVFVDASPGHPGRLTGYLEDQSDSGTPEQSFVLESRDGEAQGISFQVYRKD